MKPPALSTSCAAREIANLEGIARDESGTPLCSTEFVTILTKPRRGDGGTTNVIVRGLQEIGRKLRPDFQIVEGRDLRPGVNEAITSRQMAARFENLAIGEKLDINQVDFTIVGYFTAGGSAAESEVWTDIRDLTTARRTPDAVSIVTLRATQPAAKEALKQRIISDEQFKLQCIDETEFYGEQMKSSVAIKSVGVILATFLTLGAMFAAANTMYAAVAQRGREIGTLRALGFRRSSILLFVFVGIALACAWQAACSVAGNPAAERPVDWNGQLGDIQ